MLRYSKQGLAGIKHEARISYRSYVERHLSGLSQLSERSEQTQLMNTRYSKSWEVSCQPAFCQRVALCRSGAASGFLDSDRIASAKQS